jgi:hypothetical protein
MKIFMGLMPYGYGAFPVGKNTNETSSCGYFALRALKCLTKRH